MLNVYGPDDQPKALTESYLLTFYGDLSWLTAVELLHSLDFRECDKITILQTMPCLVKTCYHSLLTLQNQHPLDLDAQPLTSSIETTIPFWGCSPVGSTHAKSFPKSLNTYLVCQLPLMEACEATYPKRPLTSAAVK